MNTKHYIAIDLGAESGRVMLGSVSEARIELTEIHRFLNLPVHIPTNSPNGSLHWNILELWREIKTGINKAATAANAPIAGIGVDTWGVDFALLDKNLQLLANPVSYRDPRTTDIAESVFAKIPREKLYRLTGIQTLPINTLFQLATLINSPQLAAASHIVFLPDLLTFWLTGKLATEYTIASTSQMLDATTRQFSPEILQAVGIPNLFPPIDLPGTVRGNVLPSVNASLVGTPVIAVGSHDTASAVAAVPAQGDDWLYLSSGTWSLLGAEIDQPILTPAAAACNATNEGGLNNTIRLLKNIPGLWLLQECRRSWAAQGQSFDYAQLTNLAASAKPNTALLDLSDPVFSTPGDMPQKITTHCQRTNQPIPTTPGEFTRIILESLAATYAKVANELERLTSRKFTTLHIVGGGSQNKLLNQLAADATDLTVHAGPIEATAMGNILAQAIATGTIPNLPAARTLIARSFEPQVFSPCC